MRRWYIKFPDAGYALGPVSARSARDARRWARNFVGVARLPRGFECWEAPPRNVAEAREQSARH